MPQLEATARKRPRAPDRGKSRSKHRIKLERRYTVGLPPNVAAQAEKYSEMTDMSMSKAIATLVRLGLQSQEDRKHDFFKKLRSNLDSDDPKQQDRLIGEFRALILGH
jgi:hypothetical protein